MAQVYECAKCNHEFTDQEVYCEDYRDPKKCFMCPKCHTALTLAINKKYNIKLIIFSVVFSQVFSFIFKIMFNSYSATKNPMPLIIFGILFIIFIISGLAYRVKYGYKNVKTSIVQL